MGKVLVTYKEKYEEMRERYRDSLVQDDVWTKRCSDLLAKNKRLREALQDMCVLVNTVDCEDCEHKDICQER